MHQDEPAFGKFHTFHLTTYMRANVDEVEFPQWLLDLGNDTLPSATGRTSEISVRLPDLCLTSNLVNEVFGREHRVRDAEFLSRRAILRPKNEHSRVVNEDVLSRLEGALRTYKSTDSVKEDQGEDDDRE